MNFIQYSCSRKKGEIIDPVVLTKREIFVDTTEKVINTTTRFYIPYVLIKKDTVEIPADIDTAAILKDYFAVNHYKWEYRDTALAFNLADQISQNKIQKREAAYKILRPQQIVTHTTEIKKIESTVRVYGGFDVATDLNGLISPSASLFFTTKNKGAFTLGYDPFNKIYKGGLYWKLFGK